MTQRHTPNEPIDKCVPWKQAMGWQGERLFFFPKQAKGERERKENVRSLPAGDIAFLSLDETRQQGSKSLVSSRPVLFRSPVAGVCVMADNFTHTQSLYGPDSAETDRVCV